MMRFTVVLVPDEESGRYVAYVPVIPGCTTFGDTIDDALAMARDAATLLLEDMVERDDYVPTEPAGAIITSIKVEVSIPAEAVAEPAVAAGRT